MGQFTALTPNDGLKSSNPDFEVLGSYRSGQAALGQLSFGLGDVIFLTDLNTFDDARLGDLDNQKLWTNLFDYEAVPEQATPLMLLLGMMVLQLRRSVVVPQA